MDDEEEGECYVCFQAFSEHADHVPRVLGCGHTLCHSCIDRLAQVLPHPLIAIKQQQQQQQHNPRRVRCPECNFVTALPSLTSLPKNIELLRHFHRTANQPAIQHQALSGDDKLDGFFVPDHVSPFPPSQASVGVDYRSPDNRLIVGRLIGGPGAKEVGYDGVSLLFVGSGKLSKSRRKELGLVSRLGSVCHWACGVLGIMKSGTHLYLVNSIPSSSRRFAEYVLDEEASKDGLISLAVHICESLLEVHWQGMSLGVFSPAMFVISTHFTPRPLLHWNAALHLRMLMHHLATAAPDEPLDAWNYSSPEMLLALHSSSSSPCLPDDKADVWSFASFLNHLLFSPSSEVPLTFMQARQRLDGGQVNTADCSSTHGHPLQKLHQYLRKCLVLDPLQRPTMSQLWHHLKSCQSVAPHDANPEMHHDVRTRVCFGVGMQAKEDEGHPLTLQQTQPVARSVQFHPHRLQLVATLAGHGDCVTCLAVCGDKLISSSFDKCIRVWSAQDGSLVWCWEGHHSYRVLALVADATSHLCFSGDYGGGIVAWKLDEPLDTQPHMKWQEHEDWRFTGVSALAMAPDGILYSGSGDKSIKAWKTEEDHKLIATLQGHRALVSALVVSGSLLYSGSWDGCVGVWLCGEHCPLAMVDCAAGVVRALAVSSLDFSVVSAHDNGCVQIWRDGECTGLLKAHDGVVSCVAFAGESLVTGSWDKGLQIWLASDVVEDGESEAEALKSRSVDDAILSIVVAEGWQLYAATGSKINVYKSC